MPRFCEVFWYYLVDSLHVARDGREVLGVDVLSVILQVRPSHVQLMGTCTDLSTAHLDCCFCFMLAITFCQQLLKWALIKII